MNTRRLTSEQADSLADELTRQGVLHGDTVEVAIAVGVEPYSVGGPVHMAYCPSAVRVLRVMKRGTEAERQKPHSTKVRFNQGRMINRLAGGKTGFMACIAEVTSNGRISVRVKPDSLVFQAPRNEDESKRVRSSYSRPVCERLADSLVSVS